jgi:vacuolar-type H+-ATPase subunit H
MSSPTKTDAKLSPLDQIRQTEADVARQVASAREAAGYTVAQAKTQAKGFVDDARQIGGREGEKRYREIISNAEEEEQAIIAQARNRAEHLRRRAGQRLAVGVRRALNVVIGLEEAGEDE